MSRVITSGSLFDGSGGFPLGCILAGITPVWASEIEPFPVRVTTKRLPQMKHYGDITRLNGAELEPVDIITFGSPCQDMSVAGKRAGLDGSRSNLFYQAVRIIKEMRCATDDRYPRYIVWENVPGAFSSSKGEDFRSVLECVCKIKDETISVPGFEKWLTAGNIMGKDYSVAWRVLDAQYWGVPQRRRRIFLVADLAGASAGKILFESEGLSGYSAESFRAWQRAAAAAESSAGISGTGRICLNDQGGSSINVSHDIACTLRAEAHQHIPCVITPSVFKCPLDVIPAAYGMDGGNSSPAVPENIPYTLKIRCGCEGGGKGALVQSDKSATLSCSNDQTVFVPFSKGTRPHSAAEGQEWKHSETANTLTAFDAGKSRCNELAVKAFGICSNGSNSMNSPNPNAGFYAAETSRTLDCRGGDPCCNQGGIAVVSVQGSMIGRADKNGPHGSGVNENIMFTLNTTDHHAVAFARSAFTHYVENEIFSALLSTGGIYGGGSESIICCTDENSDNAGDTFPTEEPHYIVRRLTPTECARLQGFPDWWCSGLGVDDPDEKEIMFWKDVFDTYSAAAGGKKKSEKQIRKWLKNPYSDTAEYKMWGNGVALPCVYFVLAGIAFYSQDETEDI